MNITNFFTNPVGESLSSYTTVIGFWFYAAIMIVFGIYVLMKTESWHAASATFLLMALLFSAVIPPLTIFIFAIALALSFASLLIDLLVLK